MVPASGAGKAKEMNKKEDLKEKAKERLIFLKDMGIDLIKTPHTHAPAGIRRQDALEEQVSASEEFAGEKGLDQGDALKGKEAVDLLSELRSQIGDCTRCRLSAGRRHIVFGSGNPQAELMFIGEAPGVDEDIQGLPFVGRAGQLLTKIVNAIEMDREQVYIGNIIKCRPPGNRNPLPDEIETCSPFLHRQIEIIRPKIIVALGTFAAQTILNTKLPITSLRGRFMKFKGTPVMPTFHPAFLLRNQNRKKEVWEDMKLVRDELKRL